MDRRISTIFMLVWAFACASHTFNASAMEILTYEDLSVDLSTNVQLVWKAPTSQLPKRFKIYKRVLPKTFSKEIVENALRLANRTNKPPTKWGTNGFSFIDPGEGVDLRFWFPTTFHVAPRFGGIWFQITKPGSSNALPTDQTLLEAAWNAAEKLGLPRSELVPKPIQTCFWSGYEKGRKVAYGRQIWLGRRLNGIDFAGWDSFPVMGTDGLQFRLGSGGVVTSFVLSWSDLKSSGREPVATPEQMMQCIRAMHAPVLDEDSRIIAVLSKAKTITVTNVTPYYASGRIGRDTSSEERELIVAPVAELQAVADFGSSNMVFRMVSPITAPDAERLGKHGKLK